MLRASAERYAQLPKKFPAEVEVQGHRLEVGQSSVVGVPHTPVLRVGIL